jgi:ABC-type multidrug transport system fused ATPase/permease subunit
MGDDKHRKERRKAIVARLRAETMTEIGPLLLGTFAMLASSLSNQALPRLIGKLIDQKSTGTDGTKGSTASLTASLGPSLALVVLGGGVASFIRTTTLQRAEESIAARLRKRAFHSLLILKDLEWFQMGTVHDSATEEAKEKDTAQKNIPVPEIKGVSPGAIGNILDEDVETMAKSRTTTLANLIRSCSSVLFSTYHMVTLNPALFGVSLSVIPLVGAAATLLRKSIKSLTQRQREMATTTASFVEERLTHIHVVKISNRELDEVHHYEEMQDESLRLARAASIQSGAFMGFLFAASSGALLAVVNVGGQSVAQGRMTSGQLTSFATYSFLLGLGTSGIVRAANELTQSMVSAERYYRLTDIDATNDSVSNATAQDTTVECVAVDVSQIESIALRNVSFTYQSTGSRVLHSISFELTRGKVVALVGRNGSGKSTISSLLAGLYQPQSGCIELSDGRDYRTVNKQSKKSLVQLVPQSTALFNMSVLENVRYSQVDATEDKVRRALTLANCDEFVSKLEGGVHFVVGLNGSKLSGGERQRLALARALLSEPVVLVMDEPASSLDAEGESAVADAIVACRQANDNGRGLLLITHHIKNLQHADMVLVLDEGTIVEAGQMADLKANPNSALRKLMPDLK